MVPSRVAERFAGQGPKRVVCTINGTVEYQCAILPHGRGSHVITVNKQRQTKLGLRVGSRVEVTLRRDESKYGLPMPKELEELLRQDKEGRKLFHALTAGRLRTLLYIVGHAKNSDVRLLRSNIIIRHLKANRGKINYRQLSRELKGKA